MSLCEAVQLRGAVIWLILIEPHTGVLETGSGAGNIFRAAANKLCGWIMV